MDRQRFHKFCYGVVIRYAPEELREFSLLVQPLCSYAEDMTADELVETKMVLEWIRLLERNMRPGTPNPNLGVDIHPRIG